MQTIFKLTAFFVGFSLCFSLPLVAQEEEDEYIEYDEQDESRRNNYYVEVDDDYFSEEKLDQNHAFLDHEHPFPAKPRNQWEASVKLGGLFFETSNLEGSNLQLGFMAGLSLRKALGYVVSLRGEYQYKTSVANISLSDHTIFAEAVFSLTNVNYHRQEVDDNVYVFAGGGYNFTQLTSQSGTNFEREFSNSHSLLSAGVGYAYNVSTFSVATELRYAYATYFYGSQVVDGYAYANNFLTLSVQFNLPFSIGGNSVEPLWWINPLNYAYSELNIPKHQRAFKVRFKDTDEDGVADDFDKEPNTRKGCPVNALGVTQDTDQDGVPDCDDLELITPTRCQPVNEDGIGKCPDPQFNNIDLSPSFMLDSTSMLPDSDGDRVPDQLDLQRATPLGCPVDGQGRLLDTDQDGVPDCYDMEIITPSYCFPVDKNGIGNCLPPDCCEGLRFKDSTVRSKYEKELLDKMRRYDSLLNSVDKQMEQIRANAKDGINSITQKDGRINISLNNDLFFKSGIAQLSPRLSPVLQEIATVIKQNKDFEVHVEGHTDNVPINTSQYKDNWDLSTARATNIVREFSSRYGIDPSRFSSVGRGEFMPIDTNDTPEGRARNRRIEIILIPKRK